MIETKEHSEKVILVAVSDGNEEKTSASLDELSELVRTAGAEVLERFTQSLDHPVTGTYLGSGKLQELREQILRLDADGVVCDDELTPAQMKNMEELLDTKVMDRTLVILDIFAQRAATREGKIQVELAQLRYRATRLTGRGTSMSRLGGGIGTRGPGESKLESDRRAIHQRISVLKAELEEVVRHRETQRERRQRTAIPVVAIVGYTNAGKSTLLNKLTGAEILAENMLFATLDPTTRNLKLPGGEEILLTDTVGFIRKLPHHLIDAFKSTLEEARYSDVILHVVDCSNPQMKQQMETVYQTLKELGVESKPIVTAFNKCDRKPEGTLLYDGAADETVQISALNGRGLEELQNSLAEILRSRKVYIDTVIPYKDAATAALVRKLGNLISEEYTDQGIRIRAYVPKSLKL